MTDQLNNCLPCDGIQVITPRPVYNRPGLDALKYRIGTHSSFFESLLARISTLTAEELAELSLSVNQRVQQRRNRKAKSPSKTEHPLRDWLTTREKNDPAIAMLDAWSVVADVLTFYQERIANEGFLRTAQERRSIQELARLTGYRLRPGVSSTVYLAFEVEDTNTTIPFGNAPPTTQSSTPILIPKGTAVKSTPAPGTKEEPQTFETTRDFLANPEWNTLVPRQTRPTRLDFASLLHLENVYVDGSGLRMSSGDYLAIDSDPEQPPVLRQIMAVDENSQRQVTRLTIQRDELSPQKLVDEIEVLLFQYLTEEGPTPDGLLTRDFKQALRAEFKRVIDRARGSLENLRLVGIDQLFHEFACTTLTVLSNDSAAVSANMKKVLEWATSIKTQLDPMGAPGILVTKSDVVDFISGHQSLIDEQKRLVAPAVALSKQIAAVTDVSTLLQTAKESVLTSVGGSTAEALVIGHELGRDSSKPFEACKVSVPASMTGNYVVKGTICVGGETFSQERAIVLSDLLTTLQAWEVPGIVSPGSRYVLATVKEETSKKLVAASLAEIFKTSQESTFDLLELEKVSLWSDQVSGLDHLDEKIACFSDPNVIGFFAARITVLGDQDAQQLLKIKPGASGFRLTETNGKFLVTRLSSTLNTGGVFQNYLRTLKVEPQNKAAFAGNAVLVELFHDNTDIVFDTNGNSTTKPVAAALREIVRHDQSVSAIRTFTGRFVGRMSARNFPSGDITSHRDEYVQAVNTTQASLDSLLALTEGDTKPSTLKEAVEKRDQWIPDGEPDCVLEMTSRRIKIDSNTVATLKDTRIAEWNAQVKTLLDALGADPHAIAVRLSSDLTSAISELSSLPLSQLKDACDKIEKSRSDFQVRAAAIADDATVLGRELGLLKDSIAAKLSKRQSELLTRFRSVRDSVKLVFPDSPNDLNEQAVNDAFKELFDKWTNSIGKTVSLTLCESDSLLRTQVCAVLLEIGKPCDGSQHSGRLGTIVGQLTPATERQLRVVFRRWSALARQVLPEAELLTTQQGPFDLSSVSDLSQQLDQLLSSRTAGASRQSILNLFGKNSDLIPQVAATLDPGRREAFYSLLRAVRVAENPPLVVEPKVYVFRGCAKIFGWNAPKLSPNPKTNDPPVEPTFPGAGVDQEMDNVIFLDGKFSNSFVETPVAIHTFRPAKRLAADSATDHLRSFRMKDVRHRPRSALNLSAETTQLVLDEKWWDAPATGSAPGSTDHGLALHFVRTTRVYCDAERLQLAEEPMPTRYPNPDSAPNTDSHDQLLLDRPVFGLSAGAPVILSGQREVLSNEQGSAESGIQELFIIRQIDHVIDPTLFKDRYCTQITLSKPIRFPFRHESIRIYANVVEATHGETQHEVLGSGDGAKEFQKFLLKRPDVSQIVTPNERGIQSTLVVKVNDVEWSEEESLREATEQQEAFVSQTNDAQQMSVVFGDGVNGARLPTGLENIRAEYRTGLGRKGNVAGGQINQLLGAPLGVKKVNNPLAAKGGADPESRELAREHAPLAVTAMDRLLSVQDYEDFARTYAGIGKASASMIQGTVHVTIAGLDPEPLDADNPIFSNLMHAFGIFGDPSQPFELHSREASLLIIVAKIKIDRRYEWQHVQPKIRTALLELFHYDRRDLGQDVLLSDAIATMQSIEGVSYVDVDRFDAVRQDEVSDLAARLQKLQRLSRIHVSLAQMGAELRPAEICYLTPDIPDTLILELIP